MNPDRKILKLPNPIEKEKVTELRDVLKTTRAPQNKKINFEYLANQNRRVELNALRYRGVNNNGDLVTSELSY